MIAKVIAIVIGATLPIVFAARINYETAQKQAADQAVLIKMCPVVWANAEKVRNLPNYNEIKTLCPEA